MNKSLNSQPIKVGLISLGCAKNLVDGEIMLGNLLKAGIEITNDATAADAVIVNTCSFIDAAQEESVDTILESDQVREANNRGQALIVSGCLPQRFRNELPKLLPEVDAFMGIDQVSEVAQILTAAMARRRTKLNAPRKKVPSAKLNCPETPGHKKKIVAGLAVGEATEVQHNHDHASKNGLKLPPGSTGLLDPEGPLVQVHERPTYIPDFATPRFRLTPRHTAYLRIAEGCNHPCSFCIIPRMRGSHRSRAQADIVTEARALIDDGVKEINLISQDSTYYGLDLRPNHSRAISSPERFNAAVKALPVASTTICSLLRELNALSGDFWIRLLYTHPAHWTNDLIETIVSCPKVARYVDIPLQHIHQNMLERMRRETSQEYIVDLLRRIRAGVPGIALRTTFIVGFPGETEEYFETLLNFIRDTKFDRLGVFTYSREEATRAGSMAGQIPDKTKQKRRERAMAAQHDVAVQVTESFVGRTIRVLVEKEASAQDLKGARISSWEHGLIRAESNATPALKGRYLIARGEADAPDIDGRVYIRGRLPIGEFVEVKVIGHTDYDLIAEPKI
jgi:ribosomal protein S12 methylthiotransferase